jgi:[acyl-carrier-protein] S-malonyltransferase
MDGEGVDSLVECGPGKVLIGLNKRIVKGMKTMAVYDPTGLENALTEVSA